MADTVYTFRGLRTWRGREGSGWQGTLYAGQVRVAFVHDDGNGGMHDWQVHDPAALRAWEATVPARHAHSRQDDFDLAIARLADDTEAARKIARLCKSRTLFRLPDDAADTYREIRQPLTADLRAAVLRKYGASVAFLNYQAT